MRRKQPRGGGNEDGKENGQESPSQIALRTTVISTDEMRPNTSQQTADVLEVENQKSDDMKPGSSQKLADDVLPLRRRLHAHIFNAAAAADWEDSVVNEKDKQDSIISQHGLDWIFNPQSHGVTSGFEGYQELACYPIARYPENQNPLISLSMQRQLDEMSPREYLTAVLHDLSLEERESLMVYEKQRRKTFLVNWPHDNNLSGKKMAQAGFYCVDDYDRVQCVFCRGSLHKWKAGENPMVEHARFFPFCRFIKGMPCGNREYRASTLSTDDLANVHIFGNNDQLMETDCNALGISTTRAIVQRFTVCENRLRTFNRWPSTQLVLPEVLAAAGFYYTGYDDSVRCFECGGGLRKWENGDDPWAEHARWFPDCAFLRLKKGENYISQFRANTQNSRQNANFKGKEKGKLGVNSDQHKEMVTICERLGHSRQMIDLVVFNHGGPYSNITEMIDDLYTIEENYMAENREESGDRLVPNTAVEENRPTGIMQPASSQNLAYDAREYESEETPPQSCVRCYRLSRTYAPARYVGLPCGHLIFCQKCNKGVEESSKVNATVRCPFKDCGAPLNGTIRVYFG